jgi:hydroxypyruvate reductase
LSAGSDGIDGNSGVAGAVVDLLLKEKAEKLKLDIEGFLKNNDSNGFFKKCGGIFKTSPTGTNVMDICIILKE